MAGMMQMVCLISDRGITGIWLPGKKCRAAIWREIVLFAAD
jgi:hypothetical protein